MAYTRQTWRDGPTGGTPILGATLTHIEDGLFVAADTADEALDAAGTAQADVDSLSTELDNYIFLTVHDVASQSAMLALTGVQVGQDIAKRTDGAGTFLLKALPASTLTNWELIAAPPGSGTVTQVNGENPDGSGHVTLTPADIGSPSNATYAALVASLGSAAYVPTSAFDAAGAAAAVLSTSAQKANNGSDFADAGTTRYNLHVNALATAQCASTVNQSLTGKPTIDGYATQNGDVVLLAGQTAPSQNGPWQLPATGSGAWARPTDYPAAGSVKARSMKVLGGTLYKGTDWTCMTAGTITIDTTSTTWQVTGGSYFQAVLADGGATTQWTNSTFAAAQSVWAYQGVIYMRNTSGTDSTFTRANWTAMGADPSVVGGGELASTVLATTYSGSVTTSALVDVTGLAIAPVIPSSGRGVYIDLAVLVSHSVANGIVELRLYDVTAGALAVDPLGTTLGGWATTCTKAAAGFPINGRWRVAPAAGSRSYKAQVITGTSNGTVQVFGRDITFESSLTAVAR